MTELDLSTEVRNDLLFISGWLGCDVDIGCSLVGKFNFCLVIPIKSHSSHFIFLL